MNNTTEISSAVKQASAPPVHQQDVTEQALANFIFSKYGPLLTSLDLEDVLNLNRISVINIPESKLPCLCRGKGRARNKYYYSHVVSYVLEKPLSFDPQDLMRRLFAKYPTVINVQETRAILRCSRPELGAIPPDVLPVRAHLGRSGNKYMVLDVVGYIHHKLLNLNPKTNGNLKSILDISKTTQASLPLSTSEVLHAS